MTRGYISTWVGNQLARKFDFSLSVRLLYVLVDGLVAINFIFPYIGNLIIPIDEFILFRGVAKNHHQAVLCFRVGARIWSDFSSQDSALWREIRAGGSLWQAILTSELSTPLTAGSTVLVKSSALDVPQLTWLTCYRPVQSEVVWNSRWGFFISRMPQLGIAWP